MAGNLLEITLFDLRAEVQRFMGYGRTTTFASLPVAFQGDVTSIINRGLRQFYYPPVLPGETSSHKWSFLKKREIYRFYAPVAPVNTCTASFGTVTFTGSPISLIYRHTMVKFASQPGFYPVKQTNGSTQVILWDPSVSFATPTTATFYWNRAAIVGTGVNVNMFYGPSANQGPLQNVNAEYITNVEQNNNVTHWGKPRMFCVEPATWPGQGDQAVQEFHLRIYPWADAQYVMYADHTMTPDGLSSAGDSPLGAGSHGETVVASCLAIAEEFGDTPSSKYRELFMQRLAASVMSDRIGMYPSVLGYNGDASDSLSRTHLREDTVGYVGPATPITP